MLRGASFSATEPTGNDYLAAVSKLSGKAREDVALRYARERWLPPSMLAFSSWPEVALVGVDKLGHKHVLEVQVSPDFFKVGTDEATAVIAPMWPTTAQYVADELKVRTIGKKLARAVYEAAPVKGTLYLANPGEPFYDMKTGTPRNIEDSGAWAASAAKRKKWLDAKVPVAERKSTLVAGHAKDVVHQASGYVGGAPVSGKKLAIYGGGGGKTDGWAIQPFPGPHDWNYGPDYSHGIRYARKKAYLDGKRVNLDDIASDALLSVLLTDALPYKNRMSFPSKELTLASTLGESEEDNYVPTGKAGDEDEEPVEPPVAEARTQQAESSSAVPWLVAGAALYGLYRVRSRR